MLTDRPTIIIVTSCGQNTTGSKELKFQQIYGTHQTLRDWDGKLMSFARMNIRCDIPRGQMRILILTNKTAQEIIKSGIQEKFKSEGYVSVVVDHHTANFGHNEVEAKPAVTAPREVQDSLHVTDAGDCAVIGSDKAGAIECTLRYSQLLFVAGALIRIANLHSDELK